MKASNAGGVPPTQPLKFGAFFISGINMSRERADRTWLWMTLLLAGVVIICGLSGFMIGGAMQQ